MVVIYAKKVYYVTTLTSVRRTRAYGDIYIFLLYSEGFFCLYYRTLMNGNLVINKRRLIQFIKPSGTTQDNWKLNSVVVVRGRYE